MQTKNSFTKHSVRLGVLIALLLGCLAISPGVVQAAPDPAPPPGANTRDGQGSMAHITTGQFNTAFGTNALNKLTTGNNNSAQGNSALFSLTTGSQNIGVGNLSLRLTTTGSQNVAVGAGALYGNLTAARNVAVGHSALQNNTANDNTAMGWLAGYGNTTGINNVAVGNGALMNSTTGNNNIALGMDAGANLTTGTNNIDIGHMGVAGESGIIRIGTSGVHTNTFLAGTVTADVGSQNTHAAVFVGQGDFNSTPTNHVVLIKNNQASNSAILALQTADTDPSSADNFITFFNGSGTAMGSIEAVDTTTIAYVTSGNDFAEALPVAHSAQAGNSAEIVPVHGGKIGDWNQADRFMVISAHPGFVGNDRGDANPEPRSRIAFLGQVPVKIRGKVSSGDYVIASPANDGTGIAKPASKLTIADIPRIVGCAWESSDKEGLKEVNTAVGFDQTSLLVPTLQQLQHENQDLRATNTALAQKLQALEVRQARLESSQADRGVLVENNRRNSGDHGSAAGTR